MKNPFSTVAFLGFPRTGKSTYLGALWQLVQDPAEETVVELDVTGERSYLQRLGELVARGKEISRTEMSSEEGLRLTLGFEQGAVEVQIPDLSGEMLNLLVGNRTWHPRLQHTISASDAMLLFLHPEKLRLPAPIMMVDEVLSAQLSAPGIDSLEATKGQSTEVTTGHERREVEPESACTVAKCIDALENILACQQTRWPMRLGMIISAWDTVAGSPTPATWLKDRAPALDSFVRANTDMVRWSLYGVSAQGGRLPDERDNLLAKGNVRDRVYARDANGNEVSVTNPLRWALGK